MNHFRLYQKYFRVSSKKKPRSTKAKQLLKRRLDVYNLNNHSEPINVTESIESANERPVIYDDPILYESELDENRLVESPTNRSQTTFDEDLLNESENDENHLVESQTNSQQSNDDDIHNHLP